MVIKYILFVQEDTQGQRNGSATKSTECFQRTGVQFPAPVYGWSQPSVTPGLRNQIPSSGLYGHYMHVVHKHMQTQHPCTPLFQRHIELITSP